MSRFQSDRYLDKTVFTTLPRQSFTGKNDVTSKIGNILPDSLDDSVHSSQLDESRSYYGLESLHSRNLSENNFDDSGSSFNNSSGSFASFGGDKDTDDRDFELVKGFAKAFTEVEEKKPVVMSRGTLMRTCSQRMMKRGASFRGSLSLIQENLD
jgi:hypothetical protein